MFDRRSFLDTEKERKDDKIKECKGKRDKGANVRDMEGKVGKAIVW